MQVSFQYYLDIKTINEKYNGRFREDVKNSADDKLVRNYMVATKDNNGEVVRNSAENRWFKSNPGDVKECTPVAYYFAREVSGKTNVMTAAVRIAWGGQCIEKFYKGAVIYENMLKPWSKFKIKGVVWYQGESNLYKDGDRLGYALKLQMLVRDLRQLWNNPQLPFMIVQMPPATYSSRPFNDERSLPVFLEAQRQALAIPYTLMAVTSDLGMANGLHQPQKYEVAVRLANLAFANVYDCADVIPAGPQYRDFNVVDGKVIVTFETFGSKLTTKDDQGPRFFEILGHGDSEFRPAKARIDGDNVVIWHDEITKPLDVRFGFNESNLMKINLTNSEGVPAGVFWAKAPRQLHPGILTVMKKFVK
jgi:sialate O-acetylesterase